MKTLITYLLAGCAAAYAAAFDPVSSGNYVDGIDLIHIEDENAEEWTEVSRTRVRYDMHDVIARGEWDPSEGGVDTWHIETEEWVVSLELTSELTGPWGTGYGFDLTLEKLDGSWSHTLENLGMWLMEERPLVAFGGSVISSGTLLVGEYREEIAPVGWRYYYHRQNTGTAFPYTWENGGSFDTGMDDGGVFFGQYPVTYLDAPVGDEWWALSMNLTVHEGDIFARFGLGQEISRDLVFAHVPEPGVWAMMVIGLIGLVAFGRKGGK